MYGLAFVCIWDVPGCNSNQKTCYSMDFYNIKEYEGKDQHIYSKKGTVLWSNSQLRYLSSGLFTATVWCGSTTQKNRDLQCSDVKA